jgi:hypothetical protein
MYLTSANIWQFIFKLFFGLGKWQKPVYGKWQIPIYGKWQIPVYSKWAFAIYFARARAFYFLLVYKGNSK